MLEKYPEVTGTTRERLLQLVQSQKLAIIINELFRPKAWEGNGGTADALILEYYQGFNNHLQKAMQRLGNINDIISSGELGFTDADIAIAIKEDLEYALSLFN